MTNGTEATNCLFYHNELSDSTHTFEIRIGMDYFLFCSLGKVHLKKGIVNFYWNISRGTKAMTRGIGATASIASIKYQTLHL